MPRPCRAAKGLECVFPILFTQYDLVWFTLAMPCPCHDPTMPLFSRPQHNTAVSRRPCCGLEKNGMVGSWHWHGMACVNQTRPHCVNEMGKTHSKHLAARHGRGTAWARHGHGMLCVNRPLLFSEFQIQKTVAGTLITVCPGVYVTCCQTKIRWKRPEWLPIFFFQSRCYFSQCLVTARCVSVNMFLFLFWAYY
jgi:hypothetical protein